MKAEPGLASFVDRLLHVLSDLVPDGDTAETNTFVEDLEKYREQFRDASSRRDVARLAALTLAMLDIDSFKRINDTHGHPTGDRVLLCAAMRLGKSLRQSDFIARYGGEEFAVLLNDATVDEVQPRPTQVVAEIGSRSFEYDAESGTRSLRFTLSCGATELATGDSDEDLLKRADDALYEAKRQGAARS